MTVEAAVSESTQQSKAKVFISYSRKDMAFANQLEAALKARGFEPLIDRSEIYAFEEWWKRIEALIVRADTVVFVLSPDSVASEVALKEVTFAASLNKRFAPIVCRPVENKIVPEELVRLNFIFFDDAARFEDSTNRLAEALSTDIGWIRQHTEFGDLARGWALAKRPNGLLLRSPSLERAERWIASRPKGAPAPTDETQAFISLSRQAATRRIYWVGTAICLALFAFGSGGIWLSYQNHKASVIRVLRDSAEPASERITQFINEVESQLGWTTQLPWSTNTVAQHRFDVLRALRQMPAIWEIAQLDASGKEQLRVNRIDANDVIGSNTDYSKDPKFTEAVAKKVYYGPVYFRRGIVPFITISVAGRRQDAGVTVAEVDLNGLWNEVKKIKADEVSVPTCPIGSMHLAF
jgi:TIR domain-containing protein